MGKVILPLSEGELSEKTIFDKRAASENTDGLKLPRAARCKVHGRLRADDDVSAVSRHGQRALRQHHFNIRSRSRKLGALRAVE